MAFKGSYEMQESKKILLIDYCTSEFNLTQSRWPKPEDEKNDV